MAGTNRKNAPSLGGPVVVLVAPQLGQNIGMCARAMLNCGLTELRLVAPRDGWPSAAAIDAASGAHAILEAARLYDSLEEAIADLRRVYATSARPRGLAKPLVTPRQAAEDLRAFLRRGEPAGLLFGPERTGLTTEQLVLAEAVIEVPLNPAFASLNLAQAVLICGYEWFQAGAEVEPRRLPFGRSRPATKAELLAFMARLEEDLDETGFLKPPEKRPSMINNLRTLFQRAQVSEQELRTLHGILTALKEGRKGPPEAASAQPPGRAAKGRPGATRTVRSTSTKPRRRV